MNIRGYFFAAMMLIAGCTGPADGPTPPGGLSAEQRWIEVDVAEQLVILHDGPKVVAEFPAATGVNTSPETTTYPGLFDVQQMISGPLMTVPGVFVTDVVIFDLSHGNGLHSLPMDAAGNVLETTLSRPVTAGCVRVGESKSVYEFAELGMPVWIH